LLQTNYLRERLNVAAHVVAVSNSRQMLLSSTPLQGTDWQAELAKVDASVVAAHSYGYIVETAWQLQSQELQQLAARSVCINK
jgi:hypothetical protein